MIIEAVLAVLKILTLGSKATLLVDHFTTGVCKNQTFDVQIIEKIGKPGRYSNGKMNLETARLRREREKYWMNELRKV